MRIKFPTHQSWALISRVSMRGVGPVENLKACDPILPAYFQEWSVRLFDGALPTGLTVFFRVSKTRTHREGRVREQHCTPLVLFGCGCYAVSKLCFLTAQVLDWLC